MNRKAKAPHPEASLMMLVETVLHEAGAAVGFLVPDIWPERHPPVVVRIPDMDWSASLADIFSGSGARPWSCGGYKLDAEMSEDMAVYVQLAMGPGVWLALPHDHVPDLVTGMADHWIVINGPTTTAIIAAFSRLTGSTLTLTDSDWAGLGLPAVAAAMQAGSADACLTLLRRMRQRHLGAKGPKAVDP